jgi:hypothetical protein
MNYFPRHNTQGTSDLLREERQIVQMYQQYRTVNGEKLLARHRLHHSTSLTMCLFVCLGLSGTARAAATVQVLDTFPSGRDITLARNQNFNLRVAYSTDTPSGIWITPYLRDEPVAAGTSPSATLSGSGETLAWFFLMRPGDEVDEIRIRAGNGGTSSTPVVAAYPVHLVGGTEVAQSAESPAWVTELGDRARVAQEQAIRARNAQPETAGGMAVVSGFMLTALAFGVLGFGAPVWMIRRWSGPWRLAAAVPAALMAFVVLRIVVGVTRDPTSHNLWPFEIVIASALCAGLCLALLISHRLLAPSER